jgi:putative transposase
VVSPQARREQVAFACERGLSERRACGLLDIARSDAELRAAPAGQGPTGDRGDEAAFVAVPALRLPEDPHLLEAPGASARLASGRTGLWRQAGLQLPRRRPRRRIASGRPRPLPAAGANFIWAYDFVFDSCANGQQLKCLTIIDEFTRECLAIDVAGSIRSKRVIEVLTRLVSQHGAPLFLRSDNGPEFVSLAVLEWLAHAGIGTALIDPGKPWQNANDESFNGKLRDECLSVEWFRSRAEAKVVIETWRLHFNAIRPHSSLNYLTPLEFKQQHHRVPNRAAFQE